MSPKVCLFSILLAGLLVDRVGSAQPPPAGNGAGAVGGVGQSGGGSFGPGMRGNGRRADNSAASGAVEQAPSLNPARVEGTVIAEDNGEKLAKAEVTLQPRGFGANRSGNAGVAKPYVTTADAEGKFVFEKVEPGQYSISAQKNRFVDLNAFGPGARPVLLTLEKDQNLTNVGVKLKRQAIVAGRVLDRDGEPQQGIQVMVMRYMSMMGRRQLLPVGRGAQTDDEGNFRVPGLAPGAYYLLAQPVRMRFSASRNANSKPTSGADKRVTIATYYPNGRNTEEATPVTVTAGQEVPGLTIQLIESESYSVKGKLDPSLLTEGAMRPQLLLTARDQGFGMMGGGTQAAADGTFEMDRIAPGRYNLVVMGGNGRGRASATVAIEVGNSDLEGVQVIPQTAMTIQGRILGLPESNLKTIRPILTRTDAGIFFAGPPVNIQDVKIDGSFELKDVLAGSFQLMNGLADGYYLKSIRLAGQPAGSEIVIPPGSAGPLELEYGNDPGQISVSVKAENEKKDVPMTVLLLPTAAPLAVTQQLTLSVDQNGIGSFRNLAPGEYRLFAFTDYEAGQEHDPALRRKLLRSGKVVDVKAKATATVELKPELVADINKLP
jgi:hypothetical protein